MGEIVVHGQKFTIKGDTPTPTEQVAIDSFLDFRENTSGLTGNKAFDEQGVLTLSPEEVLSEANKGKYNKDTESFLGSPSFKRLVTEVGLSIAGGIAGYQAGSKIGDQIYKTGRNIVTGKKTFKNLRKDINKGAKNLYKGTKNFFDTSGNP